MSEPGAGRSDRTGAFPEGVIVSRRLLVIGNRSGWAGQTPRPMTRDLAIGIETWLTATPVERGTWPKPGGRVSRTEVNCAPWPPTELLEKLGHARRSHDDDDVTVDRLCIRLMMKVADRATVQAAKMAADLRAATRYPDAMVGHAPRELVNETAGLAILTCRTRPELIVGKPAAKGLGSPETAA